MSAKPSLFLVRGLPGAGKSSLARLLPARSVYAADDYFVDDYGVYSFDGSKLPEAHAACLDWARTDLARGHSVAVANTFTQRWELQPYLELAELSGCHLSVLSVFDGGLDDAALAKRCIHGVPVEAIARMRERFEHDWRSGHPLPPWKR